MAKKQIAYVNNEMLIWARSMTPFESSLDVQEETNIDAKKLDLWESGEDYPSIREAKRLAKVYHLPFATFFLSTPPEKEPRPYIDRRTIRGAVYNETSYKLWTEIGRIIGNREDMMEVVDEDDEEAFFEPLPSYNPDITIDELGKKIREYLGVTLPFKNKAAYKQNSFKFYRSVLESKGILVSQISGVSLNEMKGISIFYDNYPIIAVNNKDYENAKTFSLMHEMAHLVRRSSSLCMIDFDEKIDSKYNNTEERICDRIAAEILMPKDIFVVVAREEYDKNDLWDEACLNKIAVRFGVSPVAVVRRLYETRLISKEVYYSIYDEMSKRFTERKAFIDEQRKKNKGCPPYYATYLNKEGYLYTKTIMNSYSKGYISYGEMCHTLGVSSAHISKMERAVMFV